MSIFHGSVSDVPLKFPVLVGQHENSGPRTLNLPSRTLAPPKNDCEKKMSHLCYKTITDTHDNGSTERLQLKVDDVITAHKDRSSSKSSHENERGPL